MKTHEWRVVVDGIGDIGSVVEESEELARCAALSKYGEEGDRPVQAQSMLEGAAWPKRVQTSAIFEDDSFSVFPA